jgi:hypothetical protein
LRGFLSVQLSSGLILHECAVHVAGSRSWVAPPSRPWVRDGQLVLDMVTGKPKWQPLVEFSTHGVRSSWSRQILRALDETHPEVLAEATEEGRPAREMASGP